MLKRHSNGITLIELMVVVVIVAILAAIAYPSYRQQVIRSNRTEAKVALMGNSQALEKCFTRYMAYNNFASCAAAEQFEDGGSAPTPDGNYIITATFPTSDSFRLRATPQGGQTADAQCMTLTLNERGEQNIDGGSGSARDCW
jgi:type IV pilus assembly protein PilE